MKRKETDMMTKQVEQAVREFESVLYTCGTGSEQLTAAWGQFRLELQRLATLPTPGVPSAEEMESHIEAMPEPWFREYDNHSMAESMHQWISSRQPAAQGITEQDLDDIYNAAPKTDEETAEVLARIIKRHVYPLLDYMPDYMPDDCLAAAKDCLAFLRSSGGIALVKPLTRDDSRVQDIIAHFVDQHVNNLVDDLMALQGGKEALFLACEKALGLEETKDA